MLLQRCTTSLWQHINVVTMFAVNTFLEANKSSTSNKFRLMNNFYIWGACMHRVVCFDHYDLPLNSEFEEK